MSVKQMYKYSLQFKAAMMVLLVLIIMDVKAYTNVSKPICTEPAVLRFKKMETPVKRIEKPIKVKKVATPEKKPEKAYSFTENDRYLLAKIAKAEMGTEDTEAKALAILVVLNRLKSDKFPNTIKEVLYQKNQFSPIGNGSFDRLEPDEDCYKALELVESGWNESKEATFFEACPNGSTWHENNLKKLFKHGVTTFYKEKEK